MGEGGGFPTATRAVAEWFSVKERATAMGIINGGTAVGAVIAPPMIALILLYSNWRWIFFFTGALGFALDHLVAQILLSHQPNIPISPRRSRKTSLGPRTLGIRR